MVKRRDVLAGGLATGAAIAGLSVHRENAHANWGMPTPNEPFDGSLLVNLNSV